jgi:hypothetical protein
MATDRQKYGAAPTNYTPGKPTAVSGGRVPGNRDVVPSPGAEHAHCAERGADVVGRAVAGQFGGLPRREYPRSDAERLFNPKP